MGKQLCQKIQRVEIGSRTPNPHPQLFDSLGNLGELFHGPAGFKKRWRASIAH
jgi:hypothetical protein